MGAFNRIFSDDFPEIRDLFVKSGSPKTGVFKLHAGKAMH
jgi:hypothetical protein